MKKPVFVKPTFYYAVINDNDDEKSKLFCRNSVLLPQTLGLTFNVHNGTQFLKVFVSENIIGHKLGEFSASRRRYFFKKGKLKPKTRR